jgi:hypothetical protein
VGNTHTAISITSVATTHPKSHEGRGFSTEAGQASPGVAAQYRRQTPEQLDTSRERPASPAQHIGDRALKMHPADQHQQDHQNDAHSGTSQVHGYGSRRRAYCDIRSPSEHQRSDEHPRRSLKKKACPQ